MAKGRGRAGSHTSVTDGARLVVQLLEKHGRVSRGVIQAGIGAKARTIKIMEIGGGLRLTVVTKVSRQQLHVYGISSAQALALLSTPAFLSFKVNLA